MAIENESIQMVSFLNLFDLSSVGASPKDWEKPDIHSKEGNQIRKKMSSFFYRLGPVQDESLMHEYEWEKEVKNPLLNSNTPTVPLHSLLFFLLLQKQLFHSKRVDS